MNIRELWAKPAVRYTAYAGLGLLAWGIYRIVKGSRAHKFKSSIKRNPLIQTPLYHGTSSEFTEFKPTKTFRRDVESGEPIKVKPSAIFLTENKDTAGMFARDKVQIDRRLRGITTSKPIVMEVSANLKSTLDLTVPLPWEDKTGFYERYPMWMNNLGVNPDTAQVLDDLGYSVQDFVDVEIALDDPNVIEELKSMGYDSVKLREQDGSKSWAIFDPKNVISKSQLAQATAHNPLTPAQLLTAAIIIPGIPPL